MFKLYNEIYFTLILEREKSNRLIQEKEDKCLDCPDSTKEYVKEEMM